MKHTNGEPPQAGWLAARVRRSVERVAARAGALRVGVVDGEALRVDPVREVDRGAGQVRRAHAVDHDGYAAEVLDDIAVEVALVEEEVVAQAGTATRLHSDPELKVVAAFLLQKSLDLDRGHLGEVD